MDEDEGDFRATPLWYALSRGRNLPLARFLLKRGADPSYSLWTVVFQDDAVACRELLKARPRLNLRAHGETPIFYAARLRRLKTLELLIAAGADPAIPDPQGRDAVDIARARRLPKDVIGCLEELRRSRKAVDRRSAQAPSGAEHLMRQHRGGSEHDRNFERGLLQRCHLGGPRR
jgi:uncharacterized protein